MNVADQLYEARSAFIKKYNLFPQIAVLPVAAYFDLKAQIEPGRRQILHEGDSIFGMTVMVVDYFGDIRVGVLE